MNKFVKRELEKVNELLPEWDENTTHLVVSRDGVYVKQPSIKVGDKFTIRVENYIINQPSNFTLSENWNEGTVPPEEVLDITVQQVMGKMVKVLAIGKCTRIPWKGWLPLKSFKEV